MSTIFYSMAGEGRGHATRVKTLVEVLRKQHELVLFAPGVAHEFLKQTYHGTDVKVIKIPGLLFHYTSGKLNYPLTIWEGAKYLHMLRRLIRRLREMIDLREADLVITDFEPALARAARQANIPFISLDHQHFLTVSDLSSLPWRLRTLANASSWIVDAYYQGQVETLVSSFYFPKLKSHYEGRVKQIGVLLREEVLNSASGEGDHLLVYLRRFASPQILEALHRTNREVRIYGLGERPADGRLRFLPVSEGGFLEDLVNCRALICNAGNQLVGEAMYLGKPLFALPEQRNFEQYINAHYLKESGGGDWCRIDSVQPETFTRFIDARDDFACRTPLHQLSGNAAALATIQDHLPIKVASTQDTPLQSSRTCFLDS